MRQRWFGNGVQGDSSKNMEMRLPRIKEDIRTRGKYNLLFEKHIFEGIFKNTWWLLNFLKYLVRGDVKSGKFHLSKI